MTRREWISMTATAMAGVFAPLPRDAARQSALTPRLERVIAEYARQGFHRTGTTVDRQSGDWLCDQVRAAGLVPVREPFTLSRVDPVNARVVIGDRQLEGLPLFDGGFTDARGIRGRLGPLDSDAEIGLVEAPPNTAAAGALGQARRRAAHRAIVFVTRGGRAGLCPSNADLFLNPFGPPVLQVSSEASSLLIEHAQSRTEITVIASVRRTSATAFNVVTTVKGSNADLVPLIVMTPRSGWYACASERGGGIACWLELMRTLQRPQPARDVWFVASSGHELGHLGIDAFVERRTGIVARSVGWIHLGANIGAAVRPPVIAKPAEENPDRRHATPVMGQGPTIQASDDEFEAMLSRAMAANELQIARRNPRGTVPGGEAEVVHRGGGRYVSVIGSNALFHNPADRGPEVVNFEELGRFTKVFGTVAEALLTATS
jgi:hypothetical protein